MCFESCAIHKTFPFICFKGSCIREQWHLRDIKAANKRFIATMSSRQKKQNSKNRSPQKKNSSSAQDDNHDPERLTVNKPDSVFTFNNTSSDTLISIHYFLKEDSIHSDDKIFLSRYFKNHKEKAPVEITLREYSSPTDDSSYSDRMKILITYLKELSISVSIIHVTKPLVIINGPSQTIPNERIEIRVK